MKSLFLIPVVCFSLNALAIGQPDGENGPQVTYLSWCERDSVMELNDKGDVVLKIDCRKSGDSCEQREKLTAAGSVVYAFCK